MVAAQFSVTSSTNESVNTIAVAGLRILNGTFAINNGTQQFTRLKPTSFVGETLRVSQLLDLTVGAGASLYVFGNGVVNVMGSDIAGQLSVAEGGTIRFRDGTNNLNGGASMSGDGVFLIAGDNVDSPTVSINAPVTAPANLVFQDGLIAGSATLTVPNGATMTWVANTAAGTSMVGDPLSATAVTAILPGGSLVVGGPSVKTLTDWTIANAGTITFTDGGNWVLTGSAEIDNLDGGILDLQTGAPIVSVDSFSNSPSIRNDGLVTKSNSTTQTIGPAFTNSGTVRIDSGTLAFAAPMTQTAGLTTIATGANLQAGLEIDGGTLEGTGTVLGNVAGSGTVSPGGNLPGHLTINGDLCLAGPLAIDLTGPDPVTQQDLLRVTGRVRLGGLLKMNVTYAATVGSQIVFLDNAGTAPVTGTFSGLGPGSLLFTGGQNFIISYGASDGNNVALLAYPTPVRSGRRASERRSAQRSEVRSLTVTFTDRVTFAGGDANAAAAFRLRHFTHGADVGLTAAVSINAAGQTVVTLTFFGSETDPVERTTRCFSVIG